MARYKVVGTKPEPKEPPAPTLRAAAEDVARSVEQALPDAIEPYITVIRTEMVQAHNDHVAEAESHLNGFESRIAAIEKRPVERVETRVVERAAEPTHEPESFVGKGVEPAHTPTEPLVAFEFNNGEMRLRQPDGQWGPWFKLGQGGGGLTQDQVQSLINTTIATLGAPKCVGVSALPFTESVAAGNYYFVSATGQFNLEPNPADNRLITVKRTGSGDVTLDGNGNLIDGSSQIVISQQFTSISLFYCTSVGQWSVI